MSIPIALSILLFKGWPYGVAYVLPYYNHYFTSYDYRYPAPSEPFIVNNEPYETPEPPLFLKKILKEAFYDREVIFTNNKPPHFVTRSEHITTKASLSERYRWAAPYVGYSAERWNLPKKRYRYNGLPLVEFVSTKPKNHRQLYFPFVAWCGLPLERQFQNTPRKKFVVYIASNCVKKRDDLFKLLRAKDKSAEALGRCQTTEVNRAPGSWGNLANVYSQYNFGFAMENHQVKGYLTEKILAVFGGGAIPIYWGDSELVREYFNPEAFIDVGQFSHLEAAADYIYAMQQDPEKLHAMQIAPIFKDDTIPELFEILYKENAKPIQDAAKRIRAEYFALLEKNKKVN